MCTVVTRGWRSSSVRMFPHLQIGPEFAGKRRSQCQLLLRHKKIDVARLRCLDLLDRKSVELQRSPVGGRWSWYSNKGL